MTITKAQIVATIGTASSSEEVLSAMVVQGMDIARLNFSWATLEDHAAHIALIRSVAQKAGKHIPIIQDLPGPRIQESAGHTYDHSAVSGLTDHDKDLILFGIKHDIEYIALSFVSGTTEISQCREILALHHAPQKIIAKIERKIAVESLEDIIAAADAVMVARGDLGNEFPLEQIPFVQEKIIRAANRAHKPVITATQMMLSMVDTATPTRAEVTDVANAILQGSDAVMLSEETAVGQYPVEAVAMMEKIILEAERHQSVVSINPL